MAGETNQSFDLLDPRKSGREEKKRRETGVEKKEIVRQRDPGINETVDINRRGKRPGKDRREGEINKERKKERTIAGWLEGGVPRGRRI